MVLSVRSLKKEGGEGVKGHSSRCRQRRPRLIVAEGPAVVFIDDDGCRGRLCRVSDCTSVVFLRPM